MRQPYRQLTTPPRTIRGRDDRVGRRPLSVRCQVERRCWLRIGNGVGWTLLFWCTACAALGSADEPTAKRRDPARWQKAMDEFAEADRQTVATSEGIVFVGSSSIRMWDLDRWFPDLPVLNRGFGGSHIADATHYLDLLVVKHKPRIVVLYAGDNDIASGLTPAAVAADYGAFVAKLQAALPDTRLVYVAIKPSVARWQLYPHMREANRQIAEMTVIDPQQTFVDIATPMLGKDGESRAELFIDDGLHLNDEGYRVWTSLVMPHLKP